MTEKLTARLAVALLLLALPLAADPDPAAKKKPVSPPKAGFASLRDRYVRTFFKRFPVVATYLGADGFDPALASLHGKLRDYSPLALKTERQEWTDFAAELKTVSRAKLSADDRVDAEVMNAQLAFLLKNLDRHVHERALDVFLEEPFRGIEWILQGMASADGTHYGSRHEWELAADRTTAVPAYLKTALANIRRGAAGTGIPDPRLIRGSLDNASSSAEYFEKSLPKKAEEWTPADAGAAKKRLLAACVEAARAYRDFRQGLLDLYYGPDGKTLKPGFERDRFAFGEGEYTWALKNNLKVDSTPRELHAYGKRKAEETRITMEALAKTIAASHGWADASVGAVFNKLSDDVPKNDAEMLQWFKDGCAKLVAYGRETKMFDPPADYKLDVIYTPPPLRDTTTAAYYPAPPFKKEGVGQFYVTPTGDDPVGLREYARASVLDLSAHEGFPGHDWYYQFMRTKGTRISPVRWLTPGGVEDSASMWEDSMSSEGWALYCEQLVGEPREGHPEGIYTPEERLFQLQNQLLRDARVVVDTGIHCGYMTFDEAVTYFARQVFFVKGTVSTDPAANPDAAERNSVEQSKKAMYRYSKWPTQAITYHLGKAQILELREEARKIEGAGFDERRFHEEFLTQGSIPPGLFKEVLLGAARARVAK
ncbi:MAG TPA: DUF885 domain-containing protein [Thermoanaerobaculia bacterium]|nr:DUF885 domain-containing protein [Thermoanaerobaculia bacterium]